MAVEVFGAREERDGFADSKQAFLDAHNLNSRILVNLASGRKKNENAPPYDPRHPDNQWPVMVYHAEKGELVVGASLVGLTGEARKQTDKDNAATLKELQATGWRREPYPKPQVAVLDPALEKAALLERTQRAEGIAIAQQDQINKLMERLMALEKAS